MEERHDNAFKKGNGADGVVVVEPAKTARLSPASSHYLHKHSHIDGKRTVHDVSQAVNPQRILPSPPHLLPQSAVAYAVARTTDAALPVSSFPVSTSCCV